MIYAISRLAVLGTAMLLASFYAPAVSKTASSSAVGCLQLSKLDTVETLRDARALVADTGHARDRTNLGIPNLSADSVSIYSNSAACDTAANRFRLRRVAAGEPDVLWPILLIRLGGSSKYLGTTRMRDGRDYIVLDSLFTYLGEFDFN